jgi:monoamine oxidase
VGLWLVYRVRSRPVHPFWGFLEKPEGNALFAGEHTSTHSQGYLNGGVETGEWAARQVLNVLG